MALIANTTINWAVSPRIITIPAPITEITVTDLHETLLDLEWSYEGMLWEDTRNTSGGEALGGGVTVGVTSELQNAQVAFEARTIPLESGTVTTAESPAGDGTITLTDTAADFVTQGVTRGDLIINVTDGSQTTVIERLSATQLKCDGLTGGTDNDFDLNDAYDAYDVVQCRVAGGNLVAVDDLGAELSPIYPTFGTQVLLTASSSATTQNQSSLNFAVYQDEVQIDQTNSTGLAAAGTVFPAGTGQQPVLSLADGLAIAVANGFTTLRFRGSYTFSASDDVSGYNLSGDGPTLTTLTFPAGATTDGTVIRRAMITGDLGGAVELVGCHLESVVDLGSSTLETTVKGCLLEPGTVITMTAGATQPVHIIDCRSGSAGDTPVSVDWNGTGSNATINNYMGGMQFLNITNGQDVSYSGDSHLTVAASCTDGSVVVRGDVKITDNSGAGFTVLDQATIRYLLEMWQRLDLDVDNPNTYANDGSSITGAFGTLTKTTGGSSSTVQRS